MIRNPCVQGRRHALRLLRVPQRRHARSVRQQRARLFGCAVGRAARRARRRPADHVADRPRSGHPAAALPRRARRGARGACSGGFGLLAKMGDLASRQRAGKTFLALEGARRRWRRARRRTTTCSASSSGACPRPRLAARLRARRTQAPAEGRARPDAHGPGREGCARERRRLRPGAARDRHRPRQQAEGRTAQGEALSRARRPPRARASWLRG